MIAALEPVEDFEKNAYALSAPNPPGIQIVPPSVAYDFAMSRGQDEWTFILQAFVPFTADTAAQRLLDQVCSHGGPELGQGAAGGRQDARRRGLDAARRRARAQAHRRSRPQVVRCCS